MPVTPLFDWEQTEHHVIVKVQIKGFKRDAVDVFISDLLVKVNATPTYLLALDLREEIEISQSSFWCDMPTVTLKLAKRVPGKLWDTLCVDIKNAIDHQKLLQTEAEAEKEKQGDEEKSSDEAVVTTGGGKMNEDEKKEGKDVDEEGVARKTMTKEEWKAFIENRRQESLRRAEAHYNTKLDTREKQKEVEKKRMFNEQWDIERQLRKEISIKMENERRAEAEGLAEWQQSMDEAEQVQKENMMREKNKSIATPADVSFMQQMPKPRNMHGRQHVTTNVSINFTSPAEVQSMMPERTRGDEDYYRKSRYRPISVEDAPMFWKDKGDKSYKQRDWKAAVNYYSESIKRDGSFLSCVSNRAACYLRLHEYNKCVADCDLALTILSNTPASDTTQDRYKHLLKKLHTRRGAAYAWSGNLKKALQDFKCAEVYREMPDQQPQSSANTNNIESLAEIDQQISRDTGAVEALMKAQEVEKLKQMTQEQIAEKLAIEQYQGRLSHYRNEAMKAYQNGNYRRAQRVYEGLLRTNTTAPSSVFCSTSASTPSGTSQEKENVHDEEVVVDIPGDEYDLKSRSNLCATLLHMGDNQGALTQAEWILNFCSDVTDALNEPSSRMANSSSTAEGGVDSDDEEDDLAEELPPPEGVVPVANDGGSNGQREFLDVPPGQDEESAETTTTTTGGDGVRCDNKPQLDDHVRRRRRAGMLLKERTGHVYLVLKAYVRAGAACCGMKDFRKALEYFAAALRISPYDDDLRDDYHRIAEKARMDTLIGVTKMQNNQKKNADTTEVSDEASSAVKTSSSSHKSTNKLLQPTDGTVTSETMTHDASC